MRMAMAVTMAMTITMVMTMSPLEAVARGRVLLAPEAVAREVAGEAVTMSPLEAVARAVAREVSDAAESDLRLHAMDVHAFTASRPACVHAAFSFSFRARPSFLSARFFVNS